jgi:hypothetical protein
VLKGTKVQREKTVNEAIVDLWNSNFVNQLIEIDDIGEVVEWGSIFRMSFSVWSGVEKLFAHDMTVKA